MTARPRLLVDTREQAPLRFSDRVDVEVCTLPAGDYSAAGCTDLVALERKSLGDLVACVSWERERFLEQCRRLAQYPTRAVVVEAGVLDVLAERYRARVRPSCIIGTAVALHVDLGVPVIWAGSPTAAADYVERVLTRVWARAQQAAA